MIQVKNSNVDTYSSNLTSIMSINVFKRRLGNKIDLFFMVTLKLSGPGQRWYFVSVVPGSVGHVVCCTLHWWTVYRQPLLLVLRQFCGVVHKGQNGCHGEWQLVVVFDRRPSRSPTMSLRRRHELRNDDWLEDDVDWSSCHAVGPEYSQGMNTLWTRRDDLTDMFIHGQSVRYSNA